MEPVLNIAKPIRPDCHSQPPSILAQDTCCEEKLNNSPMANTPTLETKKLCGDHSSNSKHRKYNSLLRWDDQKITEETLLLYDFHQSNKEKFLQFIEYVHKIGENDKDNENLNKIFLTVYKVIIKKIDAIKERIIEKMNKLTLLKTIIKRRHSFDASVSREKMEKLRAQDQMLLTKIESCPNSYFELVRYIFESYNEITQRATAIEVLCSEMLKYITPGNNKEPPSCNMHSTIFGERVLQHKHIKKAIEETQKYALGNKSYQNIDYMIKEMLKNAQSQKVQITIKRKQNEDTEEEKEEEDYDTINEESVSTNYTCLPTAVEPPKREPSPLWDKNIDDLVSFITCNEKANKKRGHTTKTLQKKLKTKKIDESKENTPDHPLTHHPKRTYEEKKTEIKSFKDTNDIKYWQKFLLEPNSTNMDHYNMQTENYIRQFEELARQCYATIKPLKKPLLSKESLNRLRQLAYKAYQNLDSIIKRKTNSRSYVSIN